MFLPSRRRSIFGESTLSPNRIFSKTEAENVSEESRRDQAAVTVTPGRNAHVLPAPSPSNILQSD
jgi:hypothetical protein